MPREEIRCRNLKSGLNQYSVGRTAVPRLKNQAIQDSHHGVSKMSGPGAGLTRPERGCYDRNAGWSSLVARWAHNPKVGGSNPPPATKTFFWFQWVEPISQTDSKTLNPDSQPIFPKLFTQSFTQTRSSARRLSAILPCARKLDHSPTFVTRTLPSGSPRTDTLSSRAAAYKPERNRLRLLSSVPTPLTSKH
jgi:hypothetical protein